MKHSEQLHELATALAAAQSELHNPAFDSTNPHFKSKFASLANVRNTITPVLTKHGLSVSQWPETDEHGHTLVVTMLLHTSGQWMQSSLHVPVAKPDAHGTGSSITYARRYALQACVGVVGSDDDDGNAAAEPAKKASSKLLSSARDAAKGGRDSFGDFWKHASPDDRASLASHMGELKTLVEAAEVGEAA